MHCDKIMVALLDEIDSAERVFKCSFAVKTQLGALEASLQQSTLEDSRDRDLSRLIKLIKLRFRYLSVQQSKPTKWSTVYSILRVQRQNQIKKVKPRQSSYESRSWNITEMQIPSLKLPTPADPICCCFDDRRKNAISRYKKESYRKQKNKLH